MNLYTRSSWDVLYRAFRSGAGGVGCHLGVEGNAKEVRCMGCIVAWSVYTCGSFTECTCHKCTPLTCAGGEGCQNTGMVSVAGTIRCCWIRYLPRKGNALIRLKFNEFSVPVGWHLKEDKLYSEKPKVTIRAYEATELGV